MWKYRYRREVVADAEWESRCNALGEEGWSMIGAPRWQPRMVGDDGPVAAGWLCFFKRTVSNREQALRMIRGLDETPEQREASRRSIEAYRAARAKAND